MRKKRIRFEDNKQNPYILEPSRKEFAATKASWGTIFGRSGMTLEVGCGRGDYVIELARRNPERSFIGVDVKGDRLWYGSETAKKEGLTNVRFLRVQVEDLAELFNQDSLEQIWITFPGPRPKKGQAKKRLTHRRFLSLYKQLLKPSGSLSLKTDSKELYLFTMTECKHVKGMRVLEHIEDIHRQVIPNVTDIQTHFEKRFLREGKPIYYLRMGLKPSWLARLFKA